ncbi:MAG: flagellar basal body L-ring protein FlgH [Pseudobdellovibrionaceae bacterium]
MMMIAGMLFSGCATLNEFWARLSNRGSDAIVTPDSDGGSIRYSENPQMSVPSNRQYKHMTRSRMEEESELGAQAGSMWVMEGQGAYLFAQNKSRREGDVLNVKLDGPSLKQVETKVNVIKKLLKQLEEQEQTNLNGNLAANNAGGDRTPAAAKPEEKKDDAKDELVNIQQISTKIVEKEADGNYRVRGAQPFMIGKREYKVIAAGLVRPEDFNDEGISSTKLIDPQFDVVSIRRKPNNE